MNIDLDAAFRYEEFVVARHTVWEKRQRGEEAPWTSNPIVASRKFTNVFRILDPGTQFLLTDLFTGDPEVDLYRAFLYRHTGRIEAWHAAFMRCGDYPRPGGERDLLEAWREYRGEGVTSRQKKTQIRTTGGYQRTDYEKPMFTSAYLVFPQSQKPGTDKLESIVDLAARLWAEKSVVDAFLNAGTVEGRFRALRAVPGVGDFMAMQVTTDFGYRHGGDEDEFIAPGPGAVKGARALGLKPVEAVHWAQRTLHYLDLGLELSDGRVRYPSLMDSQNTLCEFSKYHRFLSKPAGKMYKPAHPGTQPAPVIPAHW